MPSAACGAVPVSRQPWCSCSRWGIGANTAMFGVVHGMLIRPLPYPEADSIVRVGHMGSTRPNDPALVSNTTLPRLQEEVESFERIAAYVQRTLVWLGPDGPRSLQGAMVSPPLFPLLRAVPHRGRLLVEEDAREEADRVALLSHGAWISHYASDPDVVGASLDVDGHAFTVVGVLAEGFSFRVVMRRSGHRWSFLRSSLAPSG